MTELLTVLVVAVLDGQDRVTEARRSEAVAEISSAALTAILALGDERDQAFQVLMDPSPHKLRSYEDSFPLTDTAIEQLRQAWESRRDLLPESESVDFNDLWCSDWPRRTRST